MISVKELCERVGATPRQLSRWAAEGLIPPPTVGVSPTGRGKCGWWPWESVAVIEEVARRRKAGEGPREVAAVMRLQGAIAEGVPDGMVEVYRGEDHDEALRVLGVLVGRFGKEAGDAMCIAVGYEGATVIGKASPALIREMVKSVCAITPTGEEAAA